MRGPQHRCRVGLVSGLLAWVLISGCSGRDCCAPPPVLSIQLAPTNSGDQQTATAGSTLPQPLRVLVRRGAQPASGVEVSWTTIRGQLSAPQTTTDASGIAVARWTLDTLAGLQSAGAEIQGGTPPDTGVGFSAVASPGPASRLLFQLQPANVFASRPLSVVRVAAVDRYGNVAIDFGGSITVTLSPGGSLGGTTSTTAVRGVATFTDLRVAQAGTGYALTASANGLPAATSAVFEVVTPGSAAIAFGNGDIYVMNADGSAQVNLTNSPANDRGAVWSPDGTKIAFTTDRDGNVEIYIMNADGSSPRNVSMSPAADVSPAWSPDGAKIAFVSNRDGNDEIYAVGVDGTGLVNLTKNPAADEYPAWSQKDAIAFVTDRDGNREVYVMGADGSHPVDVSNDPAIDSLPHWSPDGARIAFVSNRGVPWSNGIYIVNADGSGLVGVTDGTNTYTGAVWSPDGTRMVFDRSDEGIWVSSADGSAARQLLGRPADGGYYRSPSWSPDGSMIAFAEGGLCSLRPPGGCAGKPAILVMLADRSSVVTAWNQPIARDVAPVWKP